MKRKPAKDRYELSNEPGAPLAQSVAEITRDLIWERHRRYEIQRIGDLFREITDPRDRADQHIE